MDQVMDRITLYHSLYLACFAAALLCLAIAVVLFFYLDVKNCIGFLKGRQAQKEEIKEFLLEREILMVHTNEIIE